ncbi:polysaccharide deacetylase family protein [Sedimentibacter sp. zth1]|uniref:polysaccharide deacetylase family protein n=1 Tax=Sedimentibacter sp. zth1 TaxID=2816908 RepID=UPI001A9132F3|nr:polysaccharide deacetylase family protein [Sedimentibacter sp. zth1]QSX06914.1 polysaccharide deacetylase family protein [Sedimentibacter sp. zth1]
MIEKFINSRKIFVYIFCIIVIIVISLLCFFRYENNKYKITGEIVETVNLNDGTEERIKKTKENLTKDLGQANIIDISEKSDKKIEIVFEGLPDRKIVYEIIKLLEKHNTKATFFVSGIQTAEDYETVKIIINAGHKIGNYTLKATKFMDKLDSESIIQDFARASSIIYNASGVEPEILKCNATNYSDEILDITKALGINDVVDTNYILDINSFNSLDAAQGYVDNLKKGSIVSVKLNELIDKTEYISLKKDEIPVQDSSNSSNVETDNKTQEKSIIDTVSMLLTAIDNTNYKELYEQLRISNNGKKASPISEIRTTKRAVSFMFYGLGEVENSSEFNGIVENLNKLDAKATFFVTTDEIKNNTASIQKLIETGHEIGIAVLVNNRFDYYEACYQIETAKELLKEKFKYETNIILQPWSEIKNETLEAASANSMKVIKYDSGLKLENKAETNAEKVIKSTFAPNVKALKRGQSILCRMNYFDDEELLINSICMMATSKTTYPIRTISEILNDEKNIYSYPVQEDKILSSLKNTIYPGQLSDKQDDYINKIFKYYIGNPFVKNVNKLPGFNESEIVLLDKTGKIPNDDNTVFLTFDDWGSDIAIDKILSVLKKHNVKASFFVRTNYVEQNPNLLRAIAMEGHDIGSHSNEHLTLSNYIQSENKYVTLTDDQTEIFIDDIVKSYNILQNIVGDVVINDIPLLTLYFRPPTLAVSYIGLKTVFDCGYKYSISGDFSTGDYEAKSVEQLLSVLQNGLYSEGGYLLQSIESGSIIVMHMSDESKYTAQALDLYLTANEQKSYDDPTKFKFAKLSDYLH